VIHLPNLQLANYSNWWVDIYISIIVSRHIHRFITTNITALELYCSVTYTYTVCLLTSVIWRHRLAFPKLEICIMRSYPIKSRALFNNLSKVQRSCSQVMKNSIASYLHSAPWRMPNSIVHKLFFFVLGFSLNYFAMPNIFPRINVNYSVLDNPSIV
jgi:hypothetical protein